MYKGCHLNMHGAVSTLPWDFTLKKANGWVSAEFMDPLIGALSWSDER